MRRQRLDFEAVDANYRMAVVHQVVRQRESGGTHAGDEHALTCARLWIRRAQIKRIPARKQTVNLETPWQFEHVFQRARFGLRYIDGFLLLINARLHAVVANAMAGRRRHRVIDRDHRKRADREALGLDLMELGYFFFERTTG